MTHFSAIDIPGGKLAELAGEDQELEAQGYVKCRNTRCNFFNAPEIVDEYVNLTDAVASGDDRPDVLLHTCPHCGFQYNFAAQPGIKGQKRLAPGGTTHIGLPPSVQGQIGEDLVEQLGKGDFVGYGPFLWWHQGGADSNSKLDGMLQNWGVEVKTIDWTAANRRFIVNNKDAEAKNRAAQDPRAFAEELGDENLVKVLDQLDVQGVLGVLVLLNFDTDTADVFVREFPYGEWGTNQFGNPIKGVRHFRDTAAVQAFANVPFDNPLPDPTSEDFVPHHLQQQNEEFSTPFDEPSSTFSKTALDYAGDAFPAQEPQAVADQESDVSLNEWDLPTTYNFFYANGELEVSPKHSHEELQQHVGVPGDYSGPVAAGYVTTNRGQATWEVNTSIGIHALSRILKDYTEAVGWRWGGLTDIEGEPISDDFAPKKSLYWRYDTDKDHLYLSYTSKHFFEARTPLTVQGKIVRIASDFFDTTQLEDPDDEGAITEPLEALLEWADDNDMTVVAGNDNVIKRIEDLEQWNMYDPNPAPKGHDDDREPSGVFKCPSCSRIFPNWHTYMQHRRKEEPIGDEEPFEDSGFPSPEDNAIQDSHTTPMQPEIFPIAYVQKSALQQQHPKDFLDAEVPFIYDIEGDAIFVGAPGSRHSDIHGKFTPGGIVEGTYEPGGKVFIRSVTNMPYTVRHMIELWYYQHPEFEIKNVTLRDEDGNETKLARWNFDARPWWEGWHGWRGSVNSGYRTLEDQKRIMRRSTYGQTVRTLANADPAVQKAWQALKAAGAKTYVVGGAVRDLLLDKQPKDIDLMVTGLPPNAVRRTLEALPGRVDLTGKDFGVFRYRHAGHEVEIALPRKERSTGEGHQDFDVQVDHTMPVEDDLERRDFTANAIAVDLDDGELIDPYNGAEDIQNGRLRTVSEKSFEEDPLRVVRALVAFARHDLNPDRETVEQMRRSAGGLTHLPAERIQAELDKIFASKDPAAAIELAHDTGVLWYILPEVEDAWNFDQNNPHHELPLGTHLLEVLRNAQTVTDDPDVRMAALLHDIGKPRSAWINPETGYNHYYLGDEGQGANHEEVGADMTEERLKFLRYPAHRVDRIKELVNHHMWPAFNSDRGARRFLNKVGPHADDLLDLRWADQGGKSVYPTDPSLDLTAQRDLVEEARSTKAPTAISQLAIDGNDLIQSGMQPGPEMGATLQRLVEVVLEHPEYNTREKLLELANV